MPLIILQTQYVYFLLRQIHLYEGGSDNGKKCGKLENFLFKTKELQSSYGKKLQLNYRC